MLQLTIKEALAYPDYSRYQGMAIEETLKAIPIPEHFRIYHISDNETIFYVGQSMNPSKRLLAHLGMDGRDNVSPVGRFILKHAPVSDSWLFVQYTLEDCASFVAKHRATYPETSQAFYRTHDNRYSCKSKDSVKRNLYN